MVRVSESAYNQHKEFITLMESIYENNSATYSSIMIYQIEGFSKVFLEGDLIPNSKRIIDNTSESTSESTSNYVDGYFSYDDELDPLLQA